MQQFSLGIKEQDDTDKKNSSEDPHTADIDCAPHVNQTEHKCNASLKHQNKKSNQKTTNGSSEITSNLIRSTSIIYLYFSHPTIGPCNLKHDCYRCWTWHGSTPPPKICPGMVLFSLSVAPTCCCLRVSWTMPEVTWGKDGTSHWCAYSILQPKRQTVNTDVSSLEWGMGG